MVKIVLPEPGHPHVLVEPHINRRLVEIDPALIIALYKEHGALLFRGFGADIAAFRTFARTFCATAVVNESPGRQPIDPASHIHTVDGGTGAFSLHPELSREPWKPDAAFFACLSPPSRGGETIICDGVALAEALPPAVRLGLRERRLVYVRNTWPELLSFWLGTATPTDAQLAAPPAWCPYAFRRIGGDIVRYFSRPALHRPMFIDRLAFGNFLLFARFNNGRPDFPLLDDGRPVPEAWLQAIRATGDDLSAAIEWLAGDVLMLDNSRFMHGRRPIIDAQERLIATFFGYLRFAEPNVEEPPGALWRQRDFAPPPPPNMKR